MVDNIQIYLGIHHWRSVRAGDGQLYVLVQVCDDEVHGGVGSHDLHRVQAGRSGRDQLHLVGGWAHKTDKSPENESFKIFFPMQRKLKPYHKRNLGPLFWG